MEAVLSINGLQFSGSGYINGFYYNDLDDWYGQPDSAGESDDMLDDDGTFEAEQFHMGNWVASFQGVFQGLNTLEAVQAKRTLAGLRNRGFAVSVEVADEEMTTRRMCKVVRVKIPHSRHSGFPFSIDVQAHDPFRYGDPVTYPPTGLAGLALGGVHFPAHFPQNFGTHSSADGRIFLSNPGSEISRVNMDVTGGFGSGFRIDNIDTGERVIFSRPFSTSDTITIDSQNGLALLNGDTNVSTYLEQADWFTIPAGADATFQFSSLGTVTGTPLMYPTVIPAYL